MAEEEIKKSKFKLEDVIRKIFIAISLILLVISVIGLYTALNEVISVWIGYKYASIYRALLNAAILVMSVYILTLLLRK